MYRQLDLRLVSDKVLQRWARSGHTADIRCVTKRLGCVVEADYAGNASTTRFR
jgi:hypothetical protein